jgi:YkoY family integral membrane protein
MWGIEAADLPSILLAIGTLVLLEGLLSADNALVLAVMVRHLPDKRQQRRALRYGIWGAFIFRLIAVLTASFLLRFWFLKVFGGLYLLYLALKHLLFPEPESVEGEMPRRRFGSGFWATVINVELADIAFSIDSILAAVALARGLPQHLQENQALTLGIVYLGGILGIITMRFVAGFFIILLDRFQGLASGAYWLVAWIGLKLVGSGLHDAFDPRHYAPDAGWRRSIPDPIKSFHWEMPDLLFWGGMVLIILISLLYKPRRKLHLPEIAPIESADANEVAAESLPGADRH